jgi:hypothetical protein
MDLSKLPKMSETARAERERNETAGGEQTPAGAQPVVRQATPVASEMLMGAEVWISGVLGLLFVYFGWPFARWAVTTMRGGTFHTFVNWTVGPKEGQEVSYFELQGYTAWTDMSLLLFGLALLADAVLLLVASGAVGRRGWLVWGAVGITAVATACNLVTALLCLSVGIRPLYSLVAVAIGGYMLAYQWRIVKGPRVGVA